MTTFQILAHWAFTKVQLEQAQKNKDTNPEAVQPAIVAFRKWQRIKKTLDAENPDPEVKNGNGILP